MAEGNLDAMLLITISWQSLNRVINSNDKDTLLCDCTTTILFASIFIEANLNYVIECMNANDQVKQFFKESRNNSLGLQQKLGWFYNQYIAKLKAQNKDDQLYKGIGKKLRRKFPGYNKIYKFRNDVSHGFITESLAGPTVAIILRQQAKNIVEELFRIAKKNGYDIPRKITYCDVLSSQGKKIITTSNAPVQFIPITKSS